MVMSSELHFTLTFVTVSCFGSLSFSDEPSSRSLRCCAFETEATIAKNNIQKAIVIRVLVNRRILLKYYQQLLPTRYNIYLCKTHLHQRNIMSKNETLSHATLLHINWI